MGSSCEVNFGWQYTLGLLHDTDVEADFVSEIRGAISVSYVERWLIEEVGKSGLLGLRTVSEVREFVIILHR